MHLNKQTRGEVTVITFNGDLDGGTAVGVQAQLKDMIPEAGTTVLDLSGMEYISSIGLRVLLLAHRRAQDSGARVVLAGLHPDVREVMSATGFLSFFDVVETAEAEVMT